MKKGPGDWQDRIDKDGRRCSMPFFSMIDKPDEKTIRKKSEPNITPRISQSQPSTPQASRSSSRRPSLATSVPASPTILNTVEIFKFHKYSGMTVDQLRNEIRDMQDEINERKELAVKKTKLRMNMAGITAFNLAAAMNEVAGEDKYCPIDVERIYETPTGWPDDAVVHMEIGADIAFNRIFKSVLLDSPPEEERDPKKQRQQQTGQVRKY